MIGVGVTEAIPEATLVSHVMGRSSHGSMGVQSNPTGDWGLRSLLERTVNSLLSTGDAVFCQSGHVSVQIQFFPRFSKCRTCPVYTVLELNVRPPQEKTIFSDIVFRESYLSHVSGLPSPIRTCPQRVLGLDWICLPAQSKTAQVNTGFWTCWACAVSSL